MSEASEERENASECSDIFNWLLKEPEVKQLDEHYELRGVIGRGGYADVWVAKDLESKRTVAIKSLHEDKVADPQARNAFVQEARIMMYLQHPGIVPVYDFFKDNGGCLHIVMKLVLGRTLNELLDQVHEEYKGLSGKKLETMERMQLHDRLEIFLKVCDMVAFAHEKRILHRDLKPSNIMLGKQDDIYVMDWGIAEPHVSNEPLQAPEETSGTVCYLAPEIMRRKKYDERSDVYSLGLVLFELTFLHSAFTQLKTDKEVCFYAVRGKTSHRTHDYGYRVPIWLRQTIDYAIYPAPERRTPSVAVMMDQIRRGMAKDASFFGRLKRLIGL